MSFRLMLVRLLLKAMGVKKFARVPEEVFLKRLKATNKNRGFFLPDDGKAYYADQLIQEKWHCLRIQRREQPSERAILFFFGGGMLMNADKGDVASARRLSERTGCDVWFPFYPLCLEHDIEENIKMAFECYREMLKVYGPGNVSTSGCSSGGMLSLAVGLYNNSLEEKCPMPRQIVPISPGEVPVDEAERARMEAINPRDVMVDIAFMTRVEKFLRQGRTDIPEWMIHPTLGNYEGFPKVTFFYSEDEILYGAMPCFTAALKRYGVPFEVISRPGLPHCYPVMPFIPEAKEDFARLCEILSQ